MVVNDDSAAAMHRPSANNSKGNVGKDFKIGEQDGEVVQSASGTLDAVYGIGGVGRTKRALKARHITFIGFGGGIGTGLFIGTGAALAKAGPLGLLL
jgi:amino acid permease